MQLAALSKEGRATDPQTSTAATGRPANLSRADKDVAAIVRVGEHCAELHVERAESPGQPT